MRKFLASVGNAKLLGKKNDQLVHIADVRTLTESTLSFSNTQEEVRAGQGAQLYGRFSHDSGMTATLTDAMFDLNYVALQVGDTIDKTGGSGMYNDKAVKFASSTDTVTLSKTPVQIGEGCGLNHIMVWLRGKGCDAGTEWTSIEITETQATAKAFTLPDDVKSKIDTANGICAEYFVSGPQNRAASIYSNFIPAELILILTTKLFAGDASAPETGKPVGEITVKIPRFSLDGTFDLSMAMSSASTMSLQGTALAVDDGTCDGKGIYAEIVEVLEKSSVLTNLTDVLVDYDSGSPVVYGLYGTSSVSMLDSDYYVTKGDYIVVCDDASKLPGTVTAAGWITDANGNRIGYAELNRAE